MWTSLNYFITIKVNELVVKNNKNYKSLESYSFLYEFYPTFKKEINTISKIAKLIDVTNVLKYFYTYH